MHCASNVCPHQVTLKSRPNGHVSCIFWSRQDRSCRNNVGVDCLLKLWPRSLFVWVTGREKTNFSLRCLKDLKFAKAILRMARDNYNNNHMEQGGTKMRDREQNRAHIVRRPIEITHVKTVASPKGFEENMELRMV
ncbi:hypothetical protein RRG08_018041 [Elysia crispata]|uniref:Uncharacterized protein n=1 Tax=Elysia crispata TaxID=231223 RepID=A0AAE0ZDF2_9GAST|nr:hypothetical protein RRG08_018041 [Elysia crispata]